MDSQELNDAAADRKERLIAALLAADPALVLLERDETTAHLLGTNKPMQIFLVTAPSGALPDALAATLKGLTKKVTLGGSAIHVVVVGGGAEVEASIKRAVPMSQPVPMGFYHLGDTGQLALVTGRKLEILEQAAAKVDETAKLTAEALAEARRRGEALMEQERRVVAGLKDRYHVTATIAASCIVLLGVSYLWGQDVHNAALFRMGAESGAAIRRGELWRLFAAAFLHANLVHLIVNMIALWSFGTMLEALLGPRRFLVLYGASALGGSLASTLLAPDRWSVGASGAIWGLMTAGIAIALRPKGLLPALMIAGMRRRVWAPLVINLAYSFAPGIDMLAHLGGGIVGFALALTVLTDGLTPVEKRSDPASVEATPSRLAFAMAVVMGAAMAISVVVAIVVGRPWTLGSSPEMVRTKLSDTGISIELPSMISADLEATEQDGARFFTYGDLEDDPLVLEVMVVPLEREVPAGELDAFLDRERKAFEEQGPPKGVRSGPAKKVTVGPRPGVLVEEDLKGIHIMSFLVVVGAREVIVRGYELPNRPPRWQGVAERAAASIEASF